MNKSDFLRIYWKQFLLLENDFIDASEYVTIDKINYATFSSQFIKQYLTICSEIDSILDEICKVYREEEMRRNNIYAKMEIVLKNHPRMKDMLITTKYPFEGISLVPFAKFSNTDTADWWQDYNLVKHNRSEVDEGGRYFYQRANLKNVLFAMGALFILANVAFEDMEEVVDKQGNLIEVNIEPDSKLFKLHG